LTLLLILPLAFTVPAFGQGVQEDDDRREEREVVRRVLRENCLICHSEEMIASQRLTPAQWKAEVEKMVGWGAPLPAEYLKPMIEYLSAEFPVARPEKPPARRPGREFITALSPVLPAPPYQGNITRGAELYARNCANCHGADGQGDDLGSNLVEKPVLLRPEEFVRVTRDGRGRMPGFAKTLDPAADQDMLAWLRARRFRPKPPRP
jgi:mono/diheme cytochrome c family protein